MKCPICESEDVYFCAKGCRENLNFSENRYSFISCSSCGVISQFPPPTDEALANYYDLIEKRQRSHWASDSGVTLLMKMLHNRVDSVNSLSGFLHYFSSAGEQLYPYWHLLNPGRILDLGAGSGGFCLEARRKGWFVQGVEQSHESVQLAHRLGFELIEADLASPQVRHLIRDADNIVLNHVFEHIVNPEGFLRIIRDNMRTGARLFLIVPKSKFCLAFSFGLSLVRMGPSCACASLLFARFKTTTAP